MLWLLVSHTLVLSSIWIQYLHLFSLHVVHAAVGLYIFGAAPQHSYWPPSLAQLRLPIYTSTPPLPNIELSRFTWTSTCQQVLAHLRCQDRNRRYSLDNFYPSNMKPWTEDIRLTTFTCTTSLAKQHVHSSSANLELHAATWSHALAQLHLPTNTRIPPMGNLELKTFTWQDSLDNFRPWTCTSFSSCQKTHNFGMRHPAAYSPWQPHMEDVHLQTFPWHSSLWFIYWKTCGVTEKNIKQPETSHVPFASIFSWPFTCSHSLVFFSFIFFKTTRHFTWFVSLDRLFTSDNTATSFSDGSQRKASANAFQIKNKAFGLNMLVT